MRVIPTNCEGATPYARWDDVPLMSVVFARDGRPYVKTDCGDCVCLDGGALGHMKKTHGDADRLFAPFTALPNAALVLDYREGGD